MKYSTPSRHRNRRWRVFLASLFVLAAMTYPIARAFACVGERLVHYRQAGQGPVVILLHQSPASSRELEPMMQHLAPHFCVIAPDTPGYGHSEPLASPDSHPCIDAYADALAGFLDAIEVPKTAIFGSHTGAIIATRFAARFPQRITALVANGILFTTSEERQDLLNNYFPRFVPEWSGGHLAWLWSRLRDQLVYYPWYQRQASRRIEWSMSLPEIEQAALDFLHAGDNYRGAYRAVLDYDISSDLQRLSMPSCLMVSKTDALSMYLHQYPENNDLRHTQVLPDFADVPQAVVDFLQKQLSTTLGWTTRGAHPIEMVPRRYAPHSRILHLDSGVLHLRYQSVIDGKPLLLLHDIGSSSQALTSAIKSLARSGPVLAPDLPGHGLSDSFSAYDPQAIAHILLESLRYFEFTQKPLEVVAEGSSAAIALALRQMLPRLHVTLCNPRALDESVVSNLEQYLPPELEADYSGSHLIKAWTYLKDRELYSPWHVRSPASALMGQRPPSPEQLQRNLIDLLQARVVLKQQLSTAWRQATWQTLSTSDIRIFAVMGHPAHQHIQHTQILPLEHSGWELLRQS